MQLTKQELIAAVTAFLEALPERWYGAHLPVLVEMRLVHNGYGHLQGHGLAADLDWLRITGPKEDMPPKELERAAAGIAARPWWSFDDFPLPDVTEAGPDVLINHNEEQRS